MVSLILITQRNFRQFILVELLKFKQNVCTRYLNNWHYMYTQYFAFQFLYSLKVDFWWLRKLFMLHMLCQSSWEKLQLSLKYVAFVHFNTCALFCFVCVLVVATVSLCSVYFLSNTNLNMDNYGRHSGHRNYLSNCK